MGNTIDWGQAAVNNTIGFGDGAENNTIGWGDIQADSWSPETNLTGTGGTPAFTNTLSTLFDGVDDSVAMGNVLNVADDGTDRMSISFWTNTTSSTYIQRIVGKCLSNGYGYSVYKYSGTHLYFLLGEYATNYIRGTYNFSSLSDGNYHHIVWTYDGSRSATGMNLYIDGVQMSISTSSVGTVIGLVTSAEFMLGAGYKSSSPLHPYNGILDEVSIFNTELSASDVTTIYNSGTPNNISALSPLGYWRMGDGSTYPTINDEIGSNDGTMTNMSSANFVTDVPT